ncbi:hypothetical protein [uncultured Ruegeria sp.]|uniref:hypothetical protein n=1 Tax=uncultured Ruegeria sp. TaxID=259304 RepID=UPI00260DF82B|nr:hypothetical protein [uncultured Ruegeria sp.]
MCKTKNQSLTANLQSANQLRHLKFRSLNWWSWAAILSMLFVALSGHKIGLYAAMVVALAQAAVGFIYVRRIAHFPNQVRLAFVFWMILSMIPLFSFLQWSLSAGLILAVIFGYCPIARMLLLFPWNRIKPLSPELLAWIISHPVTETSILDAYHQTEKIASVGRIH